MSPSRIGLPVCLAMAACSPQAHDHGDGAVADLPDRSIVVPGFDVTVSLTAEAAAELKRRGETIKVSAVFFGLANDRGAQYASDMGDIAWSDWQDIEIIRPGVARFGPRKLNLALLDYLKDRKPEVLINVVSGRRTSKLNLLDCDTFEDSIYLAVKTGISIRCGLLDLTGIDEANLVHGER